ncbi:hypothetical protein PR048_001139 [Dryococelus australis]|uniref:Uncharacterized protein n=1 Tax=Dryococelus australis TaxID=614101 RepID=A0ABQ9IGM3_9NEOP|nr:hypothetical protein PR048_001139 [Dryococelus australis]
MQYVTPIVQELLITLENTTSATFNLPLKLSLEGNVHENSIRYKPHFLVYIRASGKDPNIPVDATAEEKEKSSRMKARALLNVAGEDAFDLAATFDPNDEEIDDYNKLIKAFDNYTGRPKNK